MIGNIKLRMATQTGNAEGGTTQVKKALKESGLNINWQDLAMLEDISFLSQASLISGVVNTWREGETPDDDVATRINDLREKLFLARISAESIG